MNSLDHPTFKLWPKKAVFCVPAQGGLTAEAVVVHRHTLVYSASGEELGTAQQLVEALLNSQAARERFGCEGMPEHKGFFLERRLTAEMGTVCLKKLEPSVLRPIELIQINGTCDFEPKSFPLKDEKQANVKVIWITGSRRKKIVRFGIRSIDGALRSSVWKCQTESGRAKSDLYLIPQGMGNAFKVSLHESGEWHMGFTSEYAAQPDAIRIRNSKERHWEVWERPEQMAPGVTRAFAVVISSSAARIACLSSLEPD